MSEPNVPDPLEWRVNGWQTGPTTVSLQPFCAKDWPYVAITFGSDTVAVVPARADESRKPLHGSEKAIANFIVRACGDYLGVEDMLRLAGMLRTGEPASSGLMRLLEREHRLGLAARLVLRDVGAGGPASDYCSADTASQVRRAVEAVEQGKST